MPGIRIINPETLGKPLGEYSQMSRSRPPNSSSKFLFIAGQVAVDRDCNTESAAAFPVGRDARRI
jgi:hypothetical protein